MPTEVQVLKKYAESHLKPSIVRTPFTDNAPPVFLCDVVGTRLCRVKSRPISTLALCQMTCVPHTLLKASLSHETASQCGNFDTMLRSSSTRQRMELRKKSSRCVPNTRLACLCQTRAKVVLERRESVSENGCGYAVGVWVASGHSGSARRRAACHGQDGLRLWDNARPWRVPTSHTPQQNWSFVICHLYDFGACHGAINGHAAGVFT